MIGYKKLSYSYVAKIEALGNIIAVGEYYRTDKMKIIEIQDEKGINIKTPVSNHFTMFEEIFYTAGEIYTVNNMNTDNNTIMCNGFHFFKTLDKAKKYWCQGW